MNIYIILFYIQVIKSKKKKKLDYILLLIYGQKSPEVIKILFNGS